MRAVFWKVKQYMIEAKCVQPLHIGSGDNGEGILTKESTGEPFIQGTSLAGVFSSYAAACRGEEEAERYFGSSRNDTKSSIVFSEGRFVPKKRKIEMRTRVRIDGATSSVMKKQDSGSGTKSGQVLDVEYISTGSVFLFSICAFDDAYGMVEECLAAMHAGIITVGGKSTIGCGRVELQKVLCKEYDMKNEKDRKDWAALDLSYMNAYDPKASGHTDILGRIKKGSFSNPYYEIEADLSLRTAMNIKANYVKRDVVERALQVKELEKLPINMPITNGNDDFIISGSSLKGVFRSRMETICNYLKIPQEKVEAVFMNKSDCIFSDSVIKSSEEGQEVACLQSRIHINKTSGAVMKKQLMSELIVAGESTVNMKVLKNCTGNGLSPEALVGLILFVLRDMELGLVTLGSGSGIGRGFVSVKEVRILDDKEKFIVEFGGHEDSVKQEFIGKCIRALKEGVVV